MSKSEQISMTEKNRKNRTEKNPDLSKATKKHWGKQFSYTWIREIQASSSYWRWRCLSLLYWQLPFTSLTFLYVILLILSPPLFSLLFSSPFFSCSPVLCVISCTFSLHYVSLCRFRHDNLGTLHARVLASSFCSS